MFIVPVSVCFRNLEHADMDVVKGQEMIYLLRRRSGVLFPEFEKNGIFSNQEICEKSVFVGNH